MDKYYLAVDIGASSGRHILGSIQNGKINIQEIHRFDNGIKDVDGSKCWDVEYLFQEILNGMKKCAGMGIAPESVGIDTWAVDYVLLDENDKILGKTYAYRDARTADVIGEVYETIPENQLYGRTGIQKQPFNTIYQLMADKVSPSLTLNHVNSLLLIPDFFHYLLSGVKATEYTNASTTQLVSPETYDWDFELIEQLGYPAHIFQKIVEPGTVLGELLPEIQKQVGFNCKVVVPGTHDTASAVAAVPSMEEHPLYISSGTWSLMGTELLKADCSEESRKANMTNEGGYGHRFRYLKNIMGLWMIQSVRHEYDDQYSFVQLCEMADEADCSSIVDVNDDRFLAPVSMIDAVKQYCSETGQQVPETPGDMAKVIYNSLAKCYGMTVRQLERITGINYKSIHVVGGGSNAKYLNKLTAKYTGKTVYAGPAEATAIGNIAVQMMADNRFAGLKEARKCISESFNINVLEVR